jgi:hypothetical protein
MRVRAVHKRLWGFRLAEKQQNHSESIERLVNLTAAFARALEADGVDQELRRCTALLNDLIAADSPLDKARRAAFEQVSRAVEKHNLSDGSFRTRPRRPLGINRPSPRAPASELIADDYPKVGKLLGDMDHIVWHLRDACRFADWLVSLELPRTTADVLRNWRERLFQFGNQVDKEHLLGCRLIARCHAVTDEQARSKDHRALCNLLAANPQRRLTDIQEAAGFLATAPRDRVRELPRRERERTPTTVEEESFVFRLKGVQWHVRFGDNSEECSFHDLNGMRYIHVLLKYAGQPVSASDVVRGCKRPVSNSHSIVDTGPDEGGPTVAKPQETLDDEAKKACRERAKKLEEEIEEAKDLEDEPRQERLERDLSDLLAQLKRDTGRGGRSRHLGSSADDKARQVVHKSLKRAYEMLEKGGMADLVAHLRDSIETGTTCVYRPKLDPPPWVLS